MCISYLNDRVHASTGHGELLEVPSFFTLDRRLQDCHYVGGIKSQLKLDAWCYELSFTDDIHQRQFLYVSQGFKIVDSNKSIPVYD